MKIVDLLADPGVHLSCEVFPPKEFARTEEVRAVVRDIAALSPAYISVTYGAAGKTPHFTREIAQTAQSCGVAALAHLTCINDNVSGIGGVLDELEAAGVTNVLALRGDIPEGMDFPTGDHFTHAAELVAYVKKRGGFCVGAACYPEGHPEASNRAQDMDYLKAKVDAGVDFLNISGAARTPSIVAAIRERYPDIPIIATGGPTDESILETIRAGANAITYTPPTSGELFAKSMREHRATYPEYHEE